MPGIEVAYWVSFSTGNAGWNQDCRRVGGGSLLDNCLTVDMEAEAAGQLEGLAVSSRDLVRALLPDICQTMVSFSAIR
jgi:hypothetical protein